MLRARQAEMKGGGTGASRTWVPPPANDDRLLDRDNHSRFVPSLIHTYFFRRKPFFQDRQSSESACSFFSSVSRIALNASPVT